MIEKLTADELEFMEILHYPIALTECLFSDLDKLPFFEEDKFSEVRIAQYTLLSHEYIIDDLPENSIKENFKLREGAGTVYVFGGRKWGKTLIVELVDILISLILNDGDEVGFSSYDQIHIRGILEKVIQVLENHPFFRIFSPKINRSPNYRIYSRNGYTLDSINMNLSGESPGAQFFQKHFKRLYIEEASFETDEVYAKRLDSVSEIGCVFRVAGMTDFTKYSPAGRIFYDASKMSVVINYPQYVNPMWDDKEREKAIREHGGEKSIGYRVFVKGEIVEDGVSAFDMIRIRKNYNRAKTIKSFEVSKENFELFEHVIVVERPANAGKIYIAADIGESAPTEIIIFSEVERKYYYIYNITLYNLTDKEQFKIFEWLASQVKVNFLAIDCTDGTGRAIYRSLAQVLPKENLVWVGFNEKIPVAFEKDDKGNEIIQDGKPVYKEEYIEAWSVKRLRDLLYEEGKVSLPLDYKLDRQLNSVKAMKSGTRVLYPCLGEDHLFAAFKVWAIAEWFSEFVNASPVGKKKFCKSGV